jgi:acetyl esterase/lipase
MWRVKIPFTLMVLSWLVLLLAAALLFLASWVALPASNYVLLAASLIATEYGAWLCIVSIVVCVLARGSSGVSRAAFVMSAAAALLVSWPLARAPFAAHRFDAEMVRAFGDGFLNRVPAATRASMRERPIVVADLFRGIPSGDVVVTRGIAFAFPDGQRLTITAYRPDANGLFPAIVQIYGGAWRGGTPDDDEGFARYFAARGYVVFGVDYRHAPRWTWPAQMQDVNTALDWIRVHGAEHQADVSRVALVGRSAGAQIALVAAYRSRALFIRGIVDFYGPTDLADGYRHPPSPDPLDVRAVLKAFLGGTPDSAPARYRDASPITYATRRQPPTLIIQGARDHIVEARFGRMLYEQLLNTGTPAAYLELPWAEHAFDELPGGFSQQISLYYAERFLAWTLASQSDVPQRH